MTREEENQLIEIAARYEAMCQALDGDEPSDFMLSFPEVRRVWDLMALNKGHVYSFWTTNPHDEDIMSAT